MTSDARVVVEEPTDERGEESFAVQLGFLAFAMTRTQLLLHDRHAQALAGHGLSGRQYTVLRLIGTVPHRSQRDVGKRLYIDRTTVVQIVDELEDLGLVRRLRSSTDRRIVTLELTEEGERRLADAAVSVDEAENDFLEPLSPHAKRILTESLQRLADEHSRARDRHEL
ncbi:MarR family winged helix-turn-helix transcriptional regulator [Rhodococcus sp. WAY2]|uniref:MarR family winged helix-turn-helix transcriptional regulator n=1 Tax=Rhodococcus sp. WAY2 TaxID=2663121 RepID=UPI00131F8F9C|nr:MarR family transcriptional regulator [Rhodococcus sp. WAY2]QHE73305.1 Transcriptional regulator, MarR family [Rhodococcus sp. WAY2]